MEDKLELIENFVGRTDIYAIQKMDGTFNPSDSNAVKEFLKNRGLTIDINQSILEKHLEEEITIGTYLLNESKCRFLIIESVDADSDGFAQIITTSKKLGLSDFVIEYARDGAFRFWYLFEQLIPAHKIKKLGEIFENELYQLKIKALPSQDMVYNYGSLVKLPLGINKESGDRSYFVDIGGRRINNPSINKIPEAIVDRILDRRRQHTAKVLGKRVRANNNRHTVHTAIHDLPCYQAIVQGVPQGFRDECSILLAKKLIQQSIPKHDCLDYLLDKWNPRNEPPISNEVIIERVNQLYSMQDSREIMETGTSCSGDSVISRFCQSHCDHYIHEYRAPNLGNKEIFLDYLKSIGQPVTESECHRDLNWIFVPRHLVTDLAERGVIKIATGQEQIFELV